MFHMLSSLIPLGKFKVEEIEALTVKKLIQTLG